MPGPLGTGGLVALSLLALGCAASGPADAGRDLHSFARPDEARTRHLALDLEVDFDGRRVRGKVVHEIERTRPEEAGRLVLDAKALDIRACRAASREGPWRETSWRLEAGDPDLGEALIIDLLPGELRVEVEYASTPEGSALQWLEPAQTAGKRRPFLFSQSQAIHGRTWIPCQDSPGVRVTYEATLRHPPELVAVMSAERLAGSDRATGGVTRFRMPQPVPSYLVALAVGDLDFRPMSERTGVWAEPSVVERAAWEFADTESMMQVVESLYGPYQWGRYDILVLPPSFPFGGMENPRLTFATPTILAGDRSLVSLVAHELAHSWSGNLVTNATHRDFWLNEGFTVYLEHRIMEALYGRERYAMEVTLGLKGLEEEMAELEPRDEVLHVDLAGRDPDDGFTAVPYDKGAAFLRRLEEVFGRERFDAFLRGYFERFRFESITTARFRRHLEDSLLASDPAAAETIDVDLWIEGPGLPSDLPRVVSEAFGRIDAGVARWRRGEIGLEGLGSEDWSTQEWLHFIDALGERADLAELAAIDEAFGLTARENAEILCAWLTLAERSGHRPARTRLGSFLLAQGRRKFLVPLYRALAATEEGRSFAAQIYRLARPTYHAISREAVDEILASRS